MLISARLCSMTWIDVRVQIKVKYVFSFNFAKVMRPDLVLFRDAKSYGKKVLSIGPRLLPLLSISIIFYTFSLDDQVSFEEFVFSKH